MSEALEVVGAGPAGLAAAITLARAGQRVVLHEAQREVGHRFGADLQGLENWTSGEDVLETLSSVGITTGFRTAPCTRGVAFDAWDRSYDIHSGVPLVYLVERGPRAASLDSALLAQALALGVELRFGSRRKALARPGIFATGPRTVDAIAAGYHFETRMADGFWLVLDDALAPRGYAYLLVMGGRGTVKACMFAGFKQQRAHVGRTVERFRRLVGLEMEHARFHCGAGSFRASATAPSGRHLIAGEQAGMQDALAGFGMRYAIISGVLAARALLGAAEYAPPCGRQVGAAVDASQTNRAIFARLGNRGYVWLLRALTLGEDARGFMRWLYGPSRIRRVLLSGMKIVHPEPLPELDPRRLAV